MTVKLLKELCETSAIPTRYVHAPNEMIHKKDLEAAIQLLVKFIESCEVPLSRALAAFFCTLV